MSQNTGMMSNIGNSLSQGYESAKGAFESARSGLSNSVDSFSKSAEGSASFMSSNTLVAKFSFLILAILVFIVLFKLGITLIMYFNSPSKSPYLVKGLLNGNDNITVSQDPNVADSILVPRSNNESSGAEFTWSSWIYIINPSPEDEKTKEFQHIFSKGTNDPDMNGLIQTNNAPGVYLKDRTNKLYVKMDTVKAGDPINTIEIDNVPIKKWVHLVLRLQNNILDVYINGTVSKRLVLQHTPKQNFQDVFVNQHGGFSGHLSDLRYFDRALNVFEINGILNNGPNLTSSSLSAFADTGFYSYLSNMWYSSHV